MENLNWKEASKSGPPIGARPHQIAYTLFQELQKDLPPGFGGTVSKTLNTVIRQAAEKLEERGLLGEESIRILGIWRGMEKLGQSLKGSGEE